MSQAARRNPPAKRPGSRGTSRNAARRPTPPRQGWMRRWPWLVGAGVVIAGVAAVVMLNGQGGASSSSNQLAYSVAQPAIGAVAPEFSLPSTAGGSVDLKSFRGKTVLLYFHEGISCESCWTQMQEIQTSMSQFQAAGVDGILTITTNTLPQLQQKVSDEGLTMPVLSDTDFSVSHAYNATAYGMMGNAADGHTFILVGPEGTILWRADYGGPPNYTMNVPVDQLLTAIRAAMHHA
ncbi:MAG: peroxiredoxin family protein [Candidatus Dormibacteria bacterium]